MRENGNSQHAAGSASVHARWTSSTELFYLRHMRSCAATAIGSKCTAGSVMSELYISGLEVLRRCLAKFASSVCTYLLQRRSPITPLEIAACCVLCDSGHNSAFPIALSVLVLSLATFDWHVSWALRHSQIICRVISVMAMQAMCVHSPSRCYGWMLLAFLDLLARPNVV